MRIIVGCTGTSAEATLTLLIAALTGLVAAFAIVSWTRLVAAFTGLITFAGLVAFTGLVTLTDYSRTAWTAIFAGLITSFTIIARTHGAPIASVSFIVVTLRTIAIPTTVL